MGAPTKDNAKRDTRITLTTNKEVYEGVKALASIDDTSINDFICKILADIVAKNTDILNAYREARGKLREKTIYR